MTKEITGYLETSLRESIVNDVRDVAHFHAHPPRKTEAGFFSIPREVFCYVDFLGHIALGKDNTESAVSFIRDYFPPSYRDYAALVYSMWRHGTVHEYKPKAYHANFASQSPKRINVAWLSNNDNTHVTRKAHLKFFPMEGKRGKIYLCINICQLVDDLIAGLDNFVKKLKSDSKLKRACQRRLNDVMKPKPYTSIRSPRWQNVVYQEIGLAWKNRLTIKLDKFGNPVRKKK